MQIRFLGALGGVTGSCTLMKHPTGYYLVDCGLDQSGAMEGSPNRGLGFDPSRLKGVFLTHAHLDHIGLLPLLVARGFQGKVYCTSATKRLLLASLEDAMGNGGIPLVSLRGVDFFEVDRHPQFEFGYFNQGVEHLSFSVIRTSHVLGSVAWEFQFAIKNGERRTIVFSGDIGPNREGHCFMPLLNARQYPSTYAEYVVCESTYGDRLRSLSTQNFEDRMQALYEVLYRARQMGEGATVIFPAFTLQRTQDLVMDLYYVLERASELDPGREFLPDACVGVDSPLAYKYAGIYLEELLRLRKNGKPLWLNPHFVERYCSKGVGVGEILRSLLSSHCSKTTFQRMTLDWAKWKNVDPGPLNILIAGSGMCQAGKVREHLKDNLPKPNTLVVFTGYQAAGTPGAELRRRLNDPQAKVDLPPDWNMPSERIKASFADLSAYYSGHADQEGLLDFVLQQQFKAGLRYRPLKRVFLNHGDDTAREALRDRILEMSGKSKCRTVEAVELPRPGDGWFDLVENQWVNNQNAVATGVESDILVWQQGEDHNRF